VPVDDAVVAVVAQVVGVAVAGEPARAAGDGGEGGVDGLDRQLALADGGLVVRQAQVLGQELRRDDHVQPGLLRGGERLRGEPLRVQVDGDGPAGRGDALEHRRPVLLRRLRDAALVVHAQRDAGDARALEQDLADRRGGVGGVVLGRDALDRPLPLDAVVELDALRPEAHEELDAAPGRLVAGVAQRVEVGPPLLVRQSRDAHAEVGQLDQERVGEQQVVLGDAGVVAVLDTDAERQLQPVDPVRRQLGQVVVPEPAVEVPGRVLDLAHVGAEHAADPVRRRPGQRQAGHLAGELQLVQQLEQRVRDAGAVAADDDEAAGRAADDERLGRVGGRAAGRGPQRRRAGRVGPEHADGERRGGDPGGTGS
jgi:hypothetical protein